MTKAQKAAQHSADIATARFKRAELDEKISKLKSKQASASMAERLKIQAEIKKLEAEKLSYPVRS